MDQPREVVPTYQHNVEFRLPDGTTVVETIESTHEYVPASVIEWAGQRWLRVPPPPRLGEPWHYVPVWPLPATPDPVYAEDDRA